MANDMLNEHHALVTGGGTGIGLAIAQALGGAGARVTITGRRLDVLKQAAATMTHCQAIAMNVADEASVTEGVDAARDTFGPISIVVLNAGIAEGRNLHKSSLGHWRKTLSINLDGAFLTLRACLPDMMGAPFARAIAVSSIAGIKGLKGAPAYTASKHGLLGLMRGLAADHAGSNMTFNTLCPAYVDTPIVTRNVENITARTVLDDKAARQLMVDVNPAGRLIAPQEVADAALWLCRKEAAAINGQAIEISGGVV